MKAKLVLKVTFGYLEPRKQRTTSTQGCQDLHSKENFIYTPRSNKILSNDFLKVLMAHIKVGEDVDTRGYASKDKLEFILHSNVGRVVYTVTTSFTCNKLLYNSKL